MGVVLGGVENAASLPPKYIIISLLAVVFMVGKVMPEVAVPPTPANPSKGLDLFSPLISNS